MTKITITSYDELRRWALKRISDSYNLWVMDRAIRDITEAWEAYIKMGAKSVEVEE